MREESQSQAVAAALFAFTVGTPHSVLDKKKY
jgi:hypothetical protein